MTYDVSTNLAPCDVHDWSYFVKYAHPEAVEECILRAQDHGDFPLSRLEAVRVLEDNDAWCAFQKFHQLHLADIALTRRFTTVLQQCHAEQDPQEKERMVTFVWDCGIGGNQGALRDAWHAFHVKREEVLARTRNYSPRIPVGSTQKLGL